MPADDRAMPGVVKPVASVTGPNLLESLGWVGGYFFLQNLALGGTIALIALAAFGTLAVSWDQLVGLMVELDLDRSFVLIGVPGLAALLVMLPLVRWRLGPDWRESLQLGRPTFRQILLGLGAVLPLGILSDEVYRQALAGWRALWDIPEMAETPLGNLGAQILAVPYPVLIVALALGPAVGEELVFRGLIGRGLTIRRGVVAGVLWTSLLFGAAHAFPPHAISTVFVGLFLHVLYLATGNLWAPILVHALVNGLAVTHLKLEGIATFETSPTVLFAASGYLLVVGTLLWHLRSHEPGAPRRVVMPTRMFPYLASCSVLSYTLVSVWTLMNG